MGLEVKKNKIHIVNKESGISDEDLNISGLIIPFSIIFKREFSPDIYSGEKVIPFKEKILEFQQILINEFLIED